MAKQNDLWDGWRDVLSTGYRILYLDGRPTRRAHKSAICPHAHHHVMRLPFGHFPDATVNMDSEACIEPTTFANI